MEFDDVQFQMEALQKPISGDVIHSGRTFPPEQSEVGQVPQQHRGAGSPVHQESH